MNTETRGRCTCAHDGHARRCPFHTQEDFDAAEATREGTAETPDGGGLTEAERAIILDPCECGHTLNDHGSLAGCWVCSEEATSDEWCMVECETLMVERIERIVTARSPGQPAGKSEGLDDAGPVSCPYSPRHQGPCPTLAAAVQARAEVVARVEAAIGPSMTDDERSPEGHEYGEGWDSGWEHCAERVRAALADPNQREDS